jgi:IclR family transcriptional regulator, acetate operon repressor
MPGDSNRSARRSTVQSVERALEVLDALRAADGPLSVLALARATGLDRTVVHRLLQTLTQHGMAVVEGGEFRLGPASVLLANSYLDGLRLRRIAMPYLLDIQSGAIGTRPWTVNLSIPIGDVTTVIERVWTPMAPLATVLDIGDTHPIQSGAAGRSILAYRPEGAVVALIGAEQAADVRPALASVREADGVALADGDVRRGVQAVASVVLSRRGEPVAAIAVSGLELGDQLAGNSELAAHLRTASRAVGQLLG